MQKRLSLSFLLALTLMLSACGFHLRGSLALNLPEGIEPIYVSGPVSTTALKNELRRLLKAYDVNLTTNAAEANHQLVIIEHKSDRRTASIGRGARAAEIQLSENVSFRMQNTSGQIILGPNNVVERRILRNDPNQVASTESEESIIRREMLNNLASKVARQVSSANYAQNTALPENNSEQSN